MLALGAGGHVTLEKDLLRLLRRLLRHYVIGAVGHLNEATVLCQGPSIVGTMPSAAVHLLLGILVEQAHEASWVLGSCNDHLLLDRCVLLVRAKATLELLGRLAGLALALLSVALEACEGLRQILE